MASESPTCRICLDSEDPASLVAPCKCSGSQRLVHKRCLQQWVATYTLQPGSSPYHPLNTYVCPVCRGFFQHRAEKELRLVSVFWTVVIGLMLVGSLISEVVLVLVTTAITTAFLRLELSIRLVWKQGLPRLELVRLLSSGTILQATSLLDYGLFQGTRLLVISNSASKGLFALILNRPKTVMGEKVHLGVITTQGPEFPQSIHILHATREIGGKEVVPGLFYGGCYLSLLAYPHIERATYYGEARWQATQLENEVAEGYWKVMGPVTVDSVLL